MANVEEKTVKKTLKEGGKAFAVTLCAIGLVYGAVNNAKGAGKIYHTPMDSSIEKTTRVALLSFSALFLAAMAGRIIDIGMNMGRQSQTRRRKDNECSR